MNETNFVCMCKVLFVEGFAGSNFGEDKLSRTQMVKIKFRGYKLSRTPSSFFSFPDIFSGEDEMKIKKKCQNL